MVMQHEDPRPQRTVSLFDIATGNTGQKQAKQRKKNLAAYHKMIADEAGRRARGEQPQYKLPFRAFLFRDGHKTAVSLAEYNKAQTDASRRVDESLYFRPNEYYDPKTKTYVESDDIRHDWETWYRVNRPTAAQREEEREARGGKDIGSWKATDWLKAVSVGMFRGLVDPLGSVEDIGSGDFLRENQAYTADQFGADVALTVGLLGAGAALGKTLKAELSTMRKQLGFEFDANLRYRNVQRLEKALQRNQRNVDLARADAAILDRDALENPEERYIRQRTTLRNDTDNAYRALMRRVRAEKLPASTVRSEMNRIQRLYKRRYTHVQRSYQRNSIAYRAEIRLKSLNKRLQDGTISVADYDTLTRKLERERLAVDRHYSGNIRENISAGDASMPDYPSGQTAETDLLHNYEQHYKNAREGIEQSVAAQRKARLDAMSPEERAAFERQYTYQSDLLEDEADKIAYDFAYDVYEPSNKRQRVMHGYTYDPERSTHNFGVWYNPDLNRVHIAHRGSVSALYDWLGSDVQIATGTEGALSKDRFNTALQRVRDVHEHYNALKDGVVIDQSGHSLGSGVSQYIMGQIGTEPWMGKTIGFNGGASPASTARLFLSKTPEERAILEQKMTNVRQVNDLVSASRAPFGKNKTYYSTANPGTAHSMDSFNLSGTRVTGGGVELVKSGAKNPQARLFTQLSGAQLRQIAASRNKKELTVDELLNLTQDDLDTMSQQPETIDIGSGGFVPRDEVATASDSFGETVEPTKEVRQQSLPIAIPVKDDVLPSAQAIPILHATPVYDKDGHVVFDSHAYAYDPDKEQTFNAVPIDTYSMDGDEHLENAYTSAEPHDVHGTYGGSGQPTQNILGYIVYPASQEQHYLNHNVVFG